MCYLEDDLWSAEAAGLAEELAALRALTTQLRSENARLLRLLELTPKQAAPPHPAQTGFFEAGARRGDPVMARDRSNLGASNAGSVMDVLAASDAARGRGHA